MITFRYDWDGRPGVLGRSDLKTGLRWPLEEESDTPIVRVGSGSDIDLWLVVNVGGNLWISVSMYRC